jgi:molybdopterin/thiamine biosynthesis adenylyltransferase
MRAVEVRIPEAEAKVILEELEKPAVRGCERVVMSLAGLSSTPEANAILVNSPRPVPEDSYQRTMHGSAWDPRFTAEVAEVGLKRRLGVLMIHGHMFGESPRLSPTDQASFEAVLPALRATVPNRPHGSLVVGTNWSAGGLVWIPGVGVHEVKRAQWMGSQVMKWPAPEGTSTAGTIYASQTNLIGNQGQYLLSQTRVGIVGLGGGGSHVAQQIARAGFGSIVLVDADMVEDKNRPRMVDSRRNDVGKPKVTVIKRMVNQASDKIRVTPVREKFPSTRTIEALKRCNLVMSCVDSYASRAELIDLSWRHLIPMIDIGIGTDIQQTEQGIGLSGLAGHIHVYVPGGPCMWCMGLLTRDKISQETEGRPEYVRGVGGPGQIISFNGVVASLAVTEAIQMVTGALLSRMRRRFLQYDGIVPSLLYSDSPRNGDCPLCNTALGSGDPVW